MDTTYPVASTEFEPVVRPAELYVAPAAAEQTYERFTVAAALEQMFKEAETAGDAWQNESYWEQEYPKDTVAFRMFMKEVHSELKQSSNVQELRQAAEAGREITVHMVEAVFRSYERAIQAAFHRLRDTLHPAQLEQLKGASRSQLDWSYRDILIEHVAHADAAPTKFSPEDFFLILNPKARKVQYMDRREILDTLRHSMAQESKGALKRDLQIIREFPPIDAGQTMISDNDLEEFTTH